METTAAPNNDLFALAGDATSLSSHLSNLLSVGITAVNWKSAMLSQSALES